MYGAIQAHPPTGHVCVRVCVCVLCVCLWVGVGVGVCVRVCVFPACTALWANHAWLVLSAAHFSMLCPSSVHVPHACRQSDLVAVVMDVGIAHVCSVTEHMTIERARIDMPIPKKRAGGAGYQVGPSM
jgi:hypothetical protein